ncbi:armadillo-type protein, partial [Coemansia spiralis]
MHSKGGQNELFETISNYTADPHPKVRQTALNSLLHQHIMGAVLPVETYDDCVAATKDDFEQVRLVALELVWAISNAYPEYPVVIQKFKVSESIRLLDDAFVKICDMVNDCSVVVRQRACSILGRFKSVDSKFLSQTFSKQVMSHLRRFVPKGMMRGYGGRNRGVRSAHSKGFIPTPEGDTDVESEEFKLLDSGAAGAFVHGLEDEYQEVRDAAIESITELCTASADFSVKAVDFLVDMFNDSSDRVRLCAIRALVAIGGRSLIQLTEEQLSIAYSAMKDSSYHVREGIYKFLAVSTLARPEWLEHLMAGFRTNLEKYPEDQLEIYKTLKVLGLNHSQVITAPFVRTLLGISEHYLSREARIDDIVYAGNVILIMNTKPHMRKAIAMVLPDYVFSHLPYLKDKYPNSLP